MRNIRESLVIIQFIIGIIVFNNLVISLLVAYQIKIIKKNHKQLIITLLGDPNYNFKSSKSKNK